MGVVMSDSNRRRVDAVRTFLCGVLACGLALVSVPRVLSAQGSTGDVEVVCLEAHEPVICQLEQDLQNAAGLGFDSQSFTEMLRKLADVERVISSGSSGTFPRQGISALRQWLEEVRSHIPRWIDEFVAAARDGGAEFQNVNWDELRSSCGDELATEDGALDYFEQGLDHLQNGTPFDDDWRHANMMVEDCESYIRLVLIQVRDLTDKLDDQVEHLERELERVARSSAVTPAPEL